MKSRTGAGKKNKSFLRLVALVLLVGGFAQAMGIFGALSFEQEVAHQQMGNALDDKQPSVREALAVEFQEEFVLQRRQQVNPPRASGEGLLPAQGLLLAAF